MSQQLLDVATKYALVPYPMERTPCDDFYTLLGPVLTPIAHARDNDLVGIGFPISIAADGAPVFDTAYPIPEIVSMKHGAFTMSCDEDIPQRKFEPLMRALSCARKDPSFLNCGVTAIKKLLPQLPDDGQHKGFLAWQFNGFVIGDCWTHATPERPLIHHFPEGSQKVAPLVAKVADLIVSRRDSTGMFRTMRRD